MARGVEGGAEIKPNFPIVNAAAANAAPAIRQFVGRHQRISDIGRGNWPQTLTDNTGPILTNKVDEFAVLDIDAYASAWAR